jgi:CubicO group peptidase (beta-lactamase class C family)
MFPALLLLALACKPDSDIRDTDTTPPTDDTGETGDTSDPDDGRVTEGCDESHEAFILALEADLAANDAPGVTAAVMEGGALTCRVALGSKSAEAEDPVGLDTLFQIGSTTKMFTAVALLQKVQDGTLGLKDTLAEAYPDSEFALDERWNDLIELEHLLTHQGGFYDYVDASASSDDGDLAAWHAITFFPNLWLMNEPGQFWNYANPNYSIAGLVAEHHDERSYPDIMLDDVFAPLGMDRTMQRKSEVQADGDFAEGTGYYLAGGSHGYGPVPIEDVPDPASGRPAGVSTWTTPAQMMEMARFLIDGDPAILEDSLRQEMTEDQVPLGYGYGDAYGYGVMTADGFQATETEYYELPLWNHGGNTSSYSSAFYIVPEQSFAVSILSSGYATDFSRSVVAAMTSLLELPDPVDPPELEFDPARLDLHVGSYSDDYNVGEIIITRQDDDLFIEMPLLDRYGYSVEPELYTVSSDVFYVGIDGAWYDLTFIGGEGDSSSQWVRNRAFVGTRQVEALRATATPEQVERTLKLAKLPELPLLDPWAPRKP